jgi:hypothetical protein
MARAVPPVDGCHPLGFYLLAEDFYRAAVQCAASKDCLPNLHYNLVLYHLHAHSIELALRAFLRVKDINEAKSAYPHGAMELLSRCMELRLRVHKPKRALQALYHLDELINLRAFRYYEAGLMKLPPIKEVSALNERVLMAVRPTCTAAFNKLSEAPLRPS